MSTQWSDFLLNMVAFAVSPLPLNFFFSDNNATIFFMCGIDLCFSPMGNRVSTKANDCLKNMFGNNEYDEGPKHSGEASCTAQNVRSGHTSAMMAAQEQAIYPNGGKKNKNYTRQPHEHTKSCAMCTTRVARPWKAGQIKLKGDLQQHMRFVTRMANESCTCSVPHSSMLMYIHVIPQNTQCRCHETSLCVARTRHKRRKRM